MGFLGGGTVPRFGVGAASRAIGVVASERRATQAAAGRAVVRPRRRREAMVVQNVVWAVCSRNASSRFGSRVARVLRVWSCSVH